MQIVMTWLCKCNNLGIRGPHFVSVASVHWDLWGISSRTLWYDVFRPATNSTCWYDPWTFTHNVLCDVCIVPEWFNSRWLRNEGKKLKNWTLRTQSADSEEVRVSRGFYTEDKRKNERNASWKPCKLEPECVRAAEKVRTSCHCRLLPRTFQIPQWRL